MYVKALLLLVCISVAPGCAEKLPTAQSQSQSNQAHLQWIEARYREATSIKEGMTFADLKKLFTEDGGMMLPNSRRYILRSCPWIKIDVELDIPQGEKLQYPPSPNVRIKKVSKPYLENGYSD
jgi:hypothetical protein